MREWIKECTNGCTSGRNVVLDLSMYSEKVFVSGEV